MPLIKCEDLCVGYEKKAVLSSLSFEVNEGDFLCIVGSNGSGKTTLMKTLLGLIPPVSGKIEFAPDVRNQVGYLPQQTQVQKDFPASVWEIVLSGCQKKMGLFPFYRKEDKELARQNIRRMGLERLSKSCYRELSGGQQQRVLLARSLCAAEKLLLLDEPVTGLDPKSTQEFYSLTRQLHSEGVTLIMITHDTLRGLDFATHILDVGGMTRFLTKELFRKAGEDNG